MSCVCAEMNQFVGAAIDDEELSLVLARKLQREEDDRVEQERLDGELARSLSMAATGVPTPTRSDSQLSRSLAQQFADEAASLELARQLAAEEDAAFARSLLEAPHPALAPVAGVDDNPDNDEALARCLMQQFEDEVSRCLC